MSTVLPSAGLPRSSRTALVGLAVALVMGFAGVWMSVAAAAQNRLSGLDTEAEMLQMVGSMPALLATSLAGWYLMRHRAAHPVGKVLLGTGLVVGAFALISGFASWVWADLGPAWTEVLYNSDTLTDLPPAITQALQFSFIALTSVVLAQVYPDGRLPGRWWTFVHTATISAFAFSVLWWLIMWGGLLHRNAAGQMEFGSTLVVLGGAPLADDSLLFTALAVAILGSVTVMLVAGVLVVVHRWRIGSPVVRRQLGIFVAAQALSTGPVVLFGLLPELGAVSGPSGWLASAAVSLLLAGGPVVVVLAIAVAVLRYNLYDIRIVVRRVVIYALSTAALTLVFVAVYSSIGVAAGGAGGGPRWAAVVAAVGVVLCLEPARRRLQRSMERRVLGDRGEPLRAMARLRERVLEGDEQSVVTGLVETVATAVRSPSVQLALQRGPRLEVVAATGASDQHALIIPLLHRGERLGEFQVKARTPGESFGRTDQALLEQLADQAAAHVYGLRRDAELTAVRQQALTATIAERSRLGRDLHDGLAPLIAGAGLAAEALRRGMVPGSQDEQDAGTLALRLRSAAGELRRVAHDLQPGPLAQAGLAGAIRDYINQLTGPDVPTFDVRVSNERLPPAVELVVYRVVLEAVANVVRHARAGRSVVSVDLTGDQVAVEIRDDGTGLHTPYVSGMGITSMRSRIEALGGELQLQARAEGGTTLRARLPLGP